MKSLLLSCLICSVLFVSCNSDDDSSEEQLSEQNYYALNVGNSWKYQYFKRIDRTDQFESLDAFDDVVITGTSEINGNEYYTFETTTTGNDTYTGVPDVGTIVTNLRDSIGYLVDENGVRLFSNSNPTQEYFIREMNVDTKLYGLLAENNETIEVPAGNFNSSLNEIFLRFPDGTISRGRDYYSYSENIGQIKTTCSFVSDSLPIQEKRLISYSILE